MFKIKKKLGKSGTLTGIKRQDSVSSNISANKDQETNDYFGVTQKDLEHFRNP